MSDESKYSEEWNISAYYFYEKGYYQWMTERLKRFNTVLEIGCGTGYSTLVLAENGYKVIAVDKNKECLVKAKQLLTQKGFKEDTIIFLEGDIVEDVFRERLVKDYNFDVVVCWNVGTCWSREMLEYYLPYMLGYGLSIEAIQSNYESSYVELIIWNVCKLAKTKGVAAHIVERGMKLVSEENDPYYYKLKNEFDFSTIEYDNKEAESISSGGRMLVSEGIVKSESKVDIIFISILYQ